MNGNIVLTSLDNLGLAPLGSNGGPTATMALKPEARPWRRHYGLLSGNGYSDHDRPARRCSTSD